MGVIENNSLVRVGVEVSGRKAIRKHHSTLVEERQGAESASLKPQS